MTRTAATTTGAATAERLAPSVDPLGPLGPRGPLGLLDPDGGTFREPREPLPSAEEVLLSLVPDPGREAAALAAAALGDGFRPEWPPARLVDQTAPGVLLAALAGEVDLATCSDDMVVGLVGAAAEADAAAALVARAGRWRGVTPAGAPHHKESAVQAERMAAAELGAALGLSLGSAMRRVSEATELARVPQTR